MVIPNVFVRESHATIGKAAQKWFVFKVYSLLMLKKIGFLLMHIQDNIYQEHVQIVTK